MPSPSWNTPAWPAASPPHRSPPPPTTAPAAKNMTTGGRQRPRPPHPAQRRARRLPGRAGPPSAGQLRRPRHPCPQAVDQRRLAAHPRRARRRPPPRSRQRDRPPPAAHPLVGPVAGLPGHRTEAMAASGSTNQRHPSTPDASTPNGTRTPVHLERVTVTDLLHELEACQPDAESASLSSPPGRSRTPSTPARPPSRSTWTAPTWSTSVRAPSSAISPSPPATSSAAYHPTSREPTMEFTPGDRVERPLPTTPTPACGPETAAPSPASPTAPSPPSTSLGQRQHPGHPPRCR